jgi:hypothetical protein
MPDIPELPKTTKVKIFKLGNKFVIKGTDLNGKMPNYIDPDKVYYIAIGEAKQDCVPEFNR